jgi:predicted small metal-binding protein
VIELRAVDRGHLGVFCTRCTWYYGMTTHHHGADLAAVIAKAMDHLDKVHGVDEIRPT